MEFGPYRFIKQFVSNPRSTGAIYPSSEKLCELVTDAAEIREALTLIELGSGTGVFTEKILEKKDPGAVFFAIEINPVFCEATRSRCPGATVYEDSAENARKYLELNGRGCCDCVVSSLPWTVFDYDTQDRLLDVMADVLRPGGVLLTFSYSASLLMPSARRFRSRLREKFSSVERSRTVWSNFPPAFVYRVEK